MQILIVVLLSTMQFQWNFWINKQIKRNYTQDTDTVVDMAAVATVMMNSHKQSKLSEFQVNVIIINIVVQQLKMLCSSNHSKSIEKNSITVMMCYQFHFKLS